MNKYTWILTPDLTDIDIDNLYNYNCYDDECLISSFYIGEILDFLEDNKIKVNYYTLTGDKWQYKIVFESEKIKINDILNKLIIFTSGRFKTTSIYMMNGSNWLKIWKKGKFFNKHLLED